jgi:plasmid stability protein
MIRVPTLYIRNVPLDVYEALKARAKREGRSVNAEALKILEDASQREAGRAAVERLWELAEGISRSPDDPTAAEVIRQMRDERDDELWRRLNRGED